MGEGLLPEARPITKVGAVLVVKMDVQHGEPFKGKYLIESGHCGIIHTDGTSDIRKIEDFPDTKFDLIKDEVFVRVQDGVVDYKFIKKGAYYTRGGSALPACDFRTKPPEDNPQQYIAMFFGDTAQTVRAKEQFFIGKNNPPPVISLN